MNSNFGQVAFRLELNEENKVKKVRYVYDPSMKMCESCEWCKWNFTTDNNEGIVRLLKCTVKDYPRICGVQKYNQSRPIFLLEEAQESPEFTNHCREYTPIGWHYENPDGLNMLDLKYGRTFDTLIEVDGEKQWVIK